MNTPENPSVQPAERKNKRRTVVAFALAALAVGGIGAAATSAAWTDNVFFSAQAEAASFNLQGSLSGANGSWVESDDQGNIVLQVPASEFANLIPGANKSVNLYVKNLGSVAADLQSSVTWASGATFTTNPTATVEGLAASLTAASGATPTDQFQLKVTTPSDWADSNKGKTGTIIIKITGTAVAP